ncbi:MAG TPA: hypothetical protein DDW31_03185 [candidate division Zixibacteria bacterium]|nr:hypothetical protein [candidate division Zixibacteria bacterium]
MSTKHGAWIAMAVLAGAVAAQPRETPDMKPPKGLWTDGRYCRQNTLDLKKLDQGLVRAKVDGRWQSFQVRPLPQAFVDWNLRWRLASLEEMKKGRMPGFSGPHSGMVASHGFRRTDGQFTVNNAVKGMGWLPKPSELAGLLQELEAGADSSTEYKLEWLNRLYRDRAHLLDDTKQISLELYATPDYATHTFLNLMSDPGVSVVFLDMVSYELRCLAQMLHPDDPGLSPEERLAVDYVNAIHDHFHGRSPRKSIVTIYHVVEVFDNTPGRGRGKRVVPPLP